MRRFPSAAICLITVSAAAFLGACNGPVNNLAKNQEYLLTVSVEGHGTVSPDTLTYNAGTSVVLVAEPAAGWHFVRWEGSGQGTGDTLQLVMDRDRAVTAVFEEGVLQYTLTVEVEGQGSVNPSSGAHGYDPNSIVNLTATAADGWRFVEWQGFAGGTDPATTVTMTGNKTVKAVFEEDTSQTLTIAVQGQGTVDPAVGQHEYERDTQVSVKAAAADGWHFVRWEGDAAGNTPSATVSMDADKTVTAVFEEDSDAYNLTIAVSGQGTTDPAAGTHSYPADGSVSLTAAAAAGWHFVRWQGDAQGTSPTVELTMGSAKTVTAIFEEDAAEYTLTVSAIGQGTVDPAVGGYSYADGQQVTLTATAGESWRFDRWQGDVTGTDNPVTVTMSATRSVTAVFVRQYRLSVAATGQGTTSPAVGDHFYDVGQTVTVSATPANGWRFLDWTGDLSSSNQSADLVMDDDKAITASFGGAGVQVMIETSKGNILVELDDELAPVTVENFLSYVDEGFYDGTDGKEATIFHRVIPDFMVQCGGFTEELEEKETHDPIVLESDNGLRNVRGTIAMARTTEPDSATSQFFINVVDNDFLNYASEAKPGYAVFGRVLEGMDVADEIVAVETASVGPHDDVPVEAIFITSVYRVEE